jgi:hypothetical protein
MAVRTSSGWRCDAAAAAYCVQTEQQQQLGMCSWVRLIDIKHPLLYNGTCILIDLADSLITCNHML